MVRGSLLCSSPGPGSAGSLRLRFIATLDRLRSLLADMGGRLLRELTELRLESCCMPALMVAAAARETEELLGDRVPGGGEVLSTPLTATFEEGDERLREWMSGIAAAVLEKGSVK